MTKNPDATITFKHEVNGVEQEVECSPQDFVALLSQKAELTEFSASINLERSIPRDKFEKNKYFISITTNVRPVYELLYSGSQSEEENEQRRKLLSKVIIDRVNKSFNLCRATLSAQQRKDGLEVVNLQEVTSLNDNSE